MDNNKNPKYTRSAVRSGHHPAPAPLYSPQALAFGSVDARDPGIPFLASAMESAAFMAARPPSALAVSATSVARTPSPITHDDGGHLSALPALTMSGLDADAASESSSAGEDDNRGWTPVNYRRRLSRPTGAEIGI
ncbi:hypothetical protein B0H17DRAFT_1148351 [Mycena rosella]|uniref:Uncharacterized protein n=1 Tax=Mycena rosella TaxID=1033263 RepID=A0AAD7CCY6_MYCRO|nr:hypothetical protein B0H17DRAFT_1148351 [Mycena rosella]